MHACRSTLEDPTEPILQVEGLAKHFAVRGHALSRARGIVQAVDGVSFSIQEGETLGIVGESGCGKSTLGRAILRLVEPTAGRVLWRGRNILTLNRREMRTLRQEMQIIFQESASAFDPRMKIGDSIGEGLVINGLVERDEIHARVQGLMQKVGLGAEYADRYPHELSGGQQQRAALARALVLQPRFLVADEPTSSLDGSVQAQILNLLRDLQQEMGLTLLFISHDLGVVRYMSNRVAVMYLGRIVEMGPVASLYESPQHPYTCALLSAAPTLDSKARREPLVVPGEPPSGLERPSGCAFHPRCPLAVPRCHEESPPLVAVAEGDHQIACFRAGEAPYGRVPPAPTSPFPAVPQKVAGARNE